MSADDLQEQVSRLEQHIGELGDVAEQCRKLILIAKAAIVVGGSLILAIIVGAISLDPSMIVAIALVIGGIVVVGSNTSTRKQTEAAMQAAEAARAELISRIDLRLVGEETIARAGPLVQPGTSNSPHWPKASRL